MQETNDRRSEKDKTHERERASLHVERPSDSNLNMLERLLFRISNGDPTLENWRTSLPPVRTLASWLDKRGVAAWHISLLAVLATVSAMLLLPFVHGISKISVVTLIAAGVLLDGFDGVLARVGKRREPFGLSGDVIDTSCDLSRILILIGGMTFAGYAPHTPWTYALAAAVTAHTVTGGLKNRIVLGRALNLFSQTTIVGGSLLLIMLGQQAASSIVQTVMMVTAAIAGTLSLHSFRLWLRARKQKPEHRE